MRVPWLAIWTALLVALIGALPSPCDAEQGAFKPAIAAIHLDRTEIWPGGTIWTTYTFTNLGESPSTGQLTILVHPRLAGEPEEKRRMFGADFQPTIPTTLWRTHAAISESRPICIPQDTPEGEYQLLIGLYSEEGGRLPLANTGLGERETRYEVARLKVTKTPLRPVPFDRRFLSIRDAPPPAAATGPETTISNERLAVRLDALAPIVRSIRHSSTGEEFLGSPHAIPPEIVICDKKSGWAYRSSLDADVGAKWETDRKADNATYKGVLDVDGRRAASLEMSFRLAEDSLVVKLDNVQEAEGFDVVEAFFRQMVSVPEAQGGTLLIPADCGREIPAKDALSTAREFGLGWFDTFLCAAVYRDQGKALALVRPAGIEDHILAWVAPPHRGLGKSASLGIRLVRRLRATPKAAQFVAQESPEVAVRFVGDLDGDGRADWVDAAKCMRKAFTFKPNPLYLQSTVFKIGCQSRPWQKEVTTFSDALSLVRRIRNLTDGLPQVAYLVGWQHNGHDTGYPDVSVVNPRLGTHADLMRLMEEAAKLDSIVSFHDNYDDAYMDSPQWDPATIAIDTNGELMKGGAWADGTRQSYIISQAKYLPKAIERTRFVVNQYHIKRTYHIDVLSSVPIRHDFDPKSPHGAQEDLDAKLAIMKEFNRLGVDVTSESVTEPFVGPATRIRHIPRGPVIWVPGERRVPFVPFIIHGHIVYGGGQAGVGGAREALLYGQTYSADFSKRTPDPTILGLIYLLDLPVKALGVMEMARYERDGAVARVRYDDRTFVEADEAKDRYRVVVAGQTIAEDYASFVEVKPGRVLAYRKEKGTLSFELPPSLRGGPVAVVPLTPGGPADPIPFDLRDNRISFPAEPDRAYRISKP